MELSFPSETSYLKDTIFKYRRISVPLTRAWNKRIYHIEIDSLHVYSTYLQCGFLESKILQRKIQVVYYFH